MKGLRLQIVPGQSSYRDHGLAKRVRKGWRRAFIAGCILHIQRDLDGGIVAARHLATNTRPFWRSLMLFITGYLSKNKEKPLVREANIYST